MGLSLCPGWSAEGPQFASLGGCWRDRRLEGHFEIKAVLAKQDVLEAERPLVTILDTDGMKTQEVWLVSPILRKIEGNQR
jgi:hypothetical protein